jgi:hypothetical protein
MCVAVGVGLYFQFQFQTLSDTEEVVRAKLLVPRNEPNLMGDAGGKRSSQADFNPRTQVAMVRSRLVLKSALKSPSVAALSVVVEQADPIGWLEKNLRVGFPDSPEVLCIELAGDRLEQRAKLVNAVVSAYMAEIVGKERIQLTDRLSVLESMRDKYLARLRMQKKDQREALGNPSDKIQEQLDRDELSDFARELRRIRLAKIAVQAKARAGAEPKTAAQEEEVALLDEQERLLGVEVERLAKRLRDRGRSAVSLDGMEQEIAAVEEIAKKISAETELLKLELQSPPRVRLLEEATAPLK